MRTQEEQWKIVRKAMFKSLAIMVRHPIAAASSEEFPAKDILSAMVHAYEGRYHKWRRDVNHAAMHYHTKRLAQIGQWAHENAVKHADSLHKYLSGRVGDLNATGRETIHIPGITDNPDVSFVQGTMQLDPNDLKSPDAFMSAMQRSLSESMKDSPPSTGQLYLHDEECPAGSDCIMRVLHAKGIREPELGMRFSPDDDRIWDGEQWKEQP
jgi:hypothetical protein